MEFNELDVIFAILGVILLIVPSIVWSFRFKKVPVNNTLIKKRRNYKRLSVIGFLLFLSVAIHITYGGRDGFDTIAMFWIIGFLITESREFLEPYFNSYITTELESQKFCLFLRPFDSDGTLNLTYFGTKVLSIEDYICEYLNKHIAQTYAVGNPGHCIPTIKSSFNIYASDSEWHELVEKLSEKCGTILLKVGDSQGCKWEIENCLKRNLMDKVLLIIEDSVSLSIAKQYLGIETEKINIKKPNIAYYDVASSQWCFFEISSKKMIDKVIIGYIQSHRTVQSILAENKTERRLGNLLKRKKVPSKFVSTVLAMMNPFALVLFNRWPVGWKISGLVYYFGAVILAGIILPENTGLGLILLFLLFLIPFFFLAPRISRYCYCWGCDAAYKRMNRELCLWLVLFIVLYGLLTW